MLNVAVLIGALAYVLSGTALLSALKWTPGRLMTVMREENAVLDAAATAAPGVLSLVVALAWVAVMLLWPAIGVLLIVAAVAVAFSWVSAWCHRLTAHPSRWCTDEEVAQSEAESARSQLARASSSSSGTPSVER
ncbi:hypothetical protein ABZ545_26880 [Streptomyces abikoensis]|uniref:hypothetical protein n=1 Tax=Streptomyces abikoensis TaxID=97398 RepID=UPI00340D74B3